MPVIPHANTWKMYGSAPEEVFLEGTTLLLTKCDGSIFLPKWKESSGSRREMDVCLSMRMPVFDCSYRYLENELEGWLKLIECA